jgi:NADPH:quinone reductase-like Zn-dependent oxidoreductase
MLPVEWVRHIVDAIQCTSAGILATVEYTDEKMPKLVQKLSSATSGGVDMCIDTVGGHWFDLAMKW